MKKYKFTRSAAAKGGALMLALFLGACAATPPSTDDIVAMKSQARWDALLSKDYATAYAYYSPGFRSTASATDLEIKMRLQRVRWTGAKYRDHSCEENVCTVRVDITYSVGNPVPGVSTYSGFDLIEEQWVKVNGEWWYVPPK